MALLRFSLLARRLCVAALLALLMMLGVAGRALAQTPVRETVTDERVWFVLVMQTRADRPGPWRYSVENIIRTRDGINAIDVLGVRPIVNYVIDKHSTVGGGFGMVMYTPATTSLIEQRLFQQYIFTTKLWRGTFTVRERLEERFIEGNSGMAARLRQQFRYSMPIRTGSKFSIVGYDELFLHLNDTTATDQGVDQNRIFGGIGQTINASMRYEVGYLNQYAPAHGAVAPRMNHVLSGSFAFSF